MRTVVTEGRGTATYFALPWLVAEDEGLFAAEGIHAEFVAPLTGAQARQPILAPVDDPGLVDVIRSHSMFEEGAVDIYSACEWGQIHRSAESKRSGKILGKRSCIASWRVSAPAIGDLHRSDSESQ